jgi:uncharacterized protein YbaR (Trm112 family)
MNYKCPECNEEMEALLFMGVQLEGYICPKCKQFYPADGDGIPELKPLAKVF